MKQKKDMRRFLCTACKRCEELACPHGSRTMDETKVFPVLKLSKRYLPGPQLNTYIQVEVPDCYHSDLYPAHKQMPHPGNK